MSSLAKLLNKERLFTVDTSSFEYTNLENLFERDGEGKAYKIRGAYIGTKSEYADESPILAIDDCYVNLPQFQLDAVKEILGNKILISGVNDGKLGFIIETYEKKLKSGAVKLCYKATFVDLADGAGL